jgi:GxxExxY protein
MGEEQYPYQELTSTIIGAAIKVHRGLGPGLLESAYEICLCDELDRTGLAFQRQVALPVIYEGRTLECGYRMDIVVENKVILEIKCADALSSIHEAQALTYLRLSGLPVALLINFNVKRLRDGIKRLALTMSSSIDSPHSAPSAPLR